LFVEIFFFRFRLLSEGGKGGKMVFPYEGTIKKNPDCGINKACQQDATSRSLSKGFFLYLFSS